MASFEIEVFQASNTLFQLTPTEFQKARNDFGAAVKDLEDRIWEVGKEVDEETAAEIIDWSYYAEGSGIRRDVGDLIGDVYDGAIKDRSEISLGLGENAFRAGNVIVTFDPEENTVRWETKESIDNFLDSSFYEPLFQNLDNAEVIEEYGLEDLPYPPIPLPTPPSPVAHQGRLDVVS